MQKIDDVGGRMMKETGEDINFKHWLTRTVMVSILLFTLVGIIDRYLGIKILMTTVLAVTIVLVIMFIHEGLHYYKAISLGYKPIWWRTKLRFGFDIETNEKTEKRKNEDATLTNNERKRKEMKDVRDIAIIPYKVIVPLSFLLVVSGFIFNIDALLYAGLASSLLHLISYKKEGALSE